METRSKNGCKSSVRVGLEEPGIVQGRGLAEILPQCNPEVSDSCRHHDDAGTNLTVIIVEEGKAVRLSALPVPLVDDYDGDLGFET
jgi:hypothetical protein